MPQPGKQEPRIACEPFLIAHSYHPDTRRGRDQFRSLAHLVGTQRLEGSRDIGDLQIKMRADGTHQRHFFINCGRIFVGLGAIALLARLEFYFVEIGIAQMLKETGRRCLGYTGHLRDFSGGVNQNIVLALKY